MKKLIIAAAIVCAATISQAAAVGWTCMNAADFKGGDYSFFVIGKNGVTSADQIMTIIAAGGLSSADSYAYFKGGEVSSAGVATRANTVMPKVDIAYSGEGTDTYTGFIFVQDANGEFASYTTTVDITMSNDSTGKTFQFGNQAANFTANKFAVGSVPEPTSGLLLLLGVAGLALKRRRA